MPGIEMSVGAIDQQQQLMMQMQEMMASVVKPADFRPSKPCVSGMIMDAVGQIAATYLLARLGVPDNLKASGGHAKSARQLAQELEVDTDMLFRGLRWAVAVGLLNEQQLSKDPDQSVLDSHGFVITPLGQLLEEDHPNTMKPLALLWGRPFHARSCEGENLHAAMKQGIPGIVPAFGEGSEYFGMMLKDTVEKDIFEKAMSGFTRMSTDLALSYDFGAHTKVVDVGGSRGALTQAILTRHPTVKTGISFDLPEVVGPCKEKGVPTELAGRMEFVGGSFFEDLPKEVDGADCMTLKFILHDWSDKACVDILHHCAASLAPGGKIVVIEHILPETVGMDSQTTSLSAFAFDLVMMGITAGGRERTLSQWTELFRAAGLNEPKVVSSAGAMACIVTSVA